MIIQDKEITLLQAYRAMLIFLEREYESTHSDDLGGLLGGYQLADGGTRTMYPAAWSDWVKAVSQAINE